MANFNKYAFVSEFKESFKSEIDNGNFIDVYEFLNETIDNEVIYYADCFAIVSELHLTEFEGYELGTATNISQLAYFGLYDYCMDEIDFSELETYKEDKENE